MNLLRKINEFSKVARNKTNIQKSSVFLYTNNELSEREIKKTIPFTITSKRIKYLGGGILDMKDLYVKKYKTLMKKLKKTQINENIFHAQGLEELILLKYLYAKQYTDSMLSLSKFQWHFSQK